MAGGAGIQTSWQPSVHTCAVVLAWLPPLGFPPRALPSSPPTPPPPPGYAGTHRNRTFPGEQVSGLVIFPSFRLHLSECQQKPRMSNRLFQNKSLSCLFCLVSFVCLLILPEPAQITQIPEPILRKSKRAKLPLCTWICDFWHFDITGMNPN